MGQINSNALNPNSLFSSNPNPPLDLRNNHQRAVPPVAPFSINNFFLSTLGFFFAHNCLCGPNPVATSSCEPDH